MGYDREKVAERLADLRSERGLSLNKLSEAIKEKTGSIPPQPKSMRTPKGSVRARLRKSPTL